MAGDQANQASIGTLESQPSSLVAPTAITTAHRILVARLLHRLGLGPRGDEYSRLLAMSPSVLMEAILTPPSTDPGATATPPPMLPYLPASATSAERSAQVTALISWWLQRMVAVEHGLTERMTWFWHGHWATSRMKVRESALMLKQNNTLRNTCLGDFGPQAQALITDPALLLWLDGDRNTKVSPNENLAREFLELFTLGVGRYTEFDVQEAARALTGWRILAPTDGSSSTSYLDPKRHDSMPAQVLGTTITSAEGLATLATQRPECPEFLARRLWFRFVSSTEPMPADTRQRVLDGLGPNRNIAAGLGALVSDPAFADPRYELVKSPVEWCVGACRSLTIPLAVMAQSSVRSNLAAMGQLPCEPPNVGGWPAGRSWLTTTSAERRIKLAGILAAAANRTWLDPIPSSGRVQAIADRLGIAVFSPNSAAVISAASASSERQLTLALLSPEYVVSQ